MTFASRTVMSAIVATDRALSVPNAATGMFPKLLALRSAHRGPAAVAEPLVLSWRQGLVMLRVVRLCDLGDLGARLVFISHAEFAADAKVFETTFLWSQFVGLHVCRCPARAARFRCRSATKIVMDTKESQK